LPPIAARISAGSAIANERRERRETSGSEEESARWRRARASGRVEWEERREFERGRREEGERKGGGRRERKGGGLRS